MRRRLFRLAEMTLWMNLGIMLDGRMVLALMVTFFVAQFAFNYVRVVRREWNS